MTGAIDRIGVVGGGAWGTALAAAALRAGRDTILWARDAATVADIADRHENLRRLPGIALDPALRATADLAEAARADAIVVAVPAQSVRRTVRALAPLVVPGTPLVLAAKGFERETGLFLSDVAAQEAPEAAVAILSGPSFAANVARGLPTAVTLAAGDEAAGRALVEALGHTTFRPYRTTDVAGTQVGGAVKNVLAIACGTVEGRSLGASALAALVARGFAELSRFGQALGARAETLAGLSGLGDLVLTATNAQSRNFSFGIELGRGGGVEAILGGRSAVTEGVWTASAVVARADALGIEMPISQAVADVVAGQLDVDAAIEGLLSRPFREE